jgi:spore photoproduct lyase
MVQEKERKSPFIHINDKANNHNGIVCEPFYVLSYYTGCPFACTYCYLQLTFRGQVNPILYCNREKLLGELEEWLAQPGRLRLNSGELYDSLALDGKIPIVDDLVPRFISQDKHMLILVTKSANIKNLLKYHPNNRVIVAFSVNSVTAWSRFEKKTPHPFRRLEAAARVSEAGYITFLRLDPILPVYNWEKEYVDLIEKAYNFFRPHQWTLGSLRFFPGLPIWAAKNGRRAEVFNFGVEISPEDNRRRLKTHVRMSLYQEAIQKIREHDLSVPIRLCKETVSMHKLLNLNCQGCCYSTLFPSKSNTPGR